LKQDTTTGAKWPGELLVVAEWTRGLAELGGHKDDGIGPLVERTIAPREMAVA
jgi:hypothetical protein